MFKSGGFPSNQTLKEKIGPLHTKYEKLKMLFFPTHATMLALPYDKNII